jgi:colanic acid/amylovoran biosynthesis glycosyltransferase
MSQPHGPAATVPMFEGSAHADTVVFLLPTYPAWYAPALGTEMRLLRAKGVDVQVLALDQDPDRAGWVRRAVAGMRSLARHTLAHCRILSTSPAAYRRGAQAAWQHARMHGQGAHRYVRWLWYFYRAIGIGERLQRQGVARCHAHFTTNIATLIADVFEIEMSLTLHGPADFARVPPALLQAKVRTSAFTRVISMDGLRSVLRACATEDQHRIVYVPLGVDLSHFTTRSAPRNARAVRIVCVARLEPVKGHSVLIDAFARIASAGRPVELLLVGDGRLRATLRRRIQALGLEGLVTCTGVVDNGTLPYLLQTADVFALASYAEGVPVALMEAMASGLPCVATRVNGVPELLVHARSGLLVAPGDVAALASALNVLIDGPRLRARLGEAGRRDVAANYDASMNADRMAAALNTTGGAQRRLRAVSHPGRSSRRQMVSSPDWLIANPRPRIAR